MKCCGGAFLFEYYHKEGGGYHKEESYEGFFRELFLKHEIRKDHGDDYTHFIDRDDDAYVSVTDGIIVAEPGGSRCDSRESDKEKLLFIYLSNSLMFFSCKDDHPRHYEYNGGS